MVQQRTQEMEEHNRTWARDAVEYAIARNNSLTVRARAFYLRGQFREAHRLLTLSLSDLGEHTSRERLSRATTYLFRAELLAISAHVHLEGVANLPSSIRKIETALENVSAAARWLEPSADRPMWWLRLYVGRAQIRHEQLLYEVRRMSEGVVPGDWTYAQRSLWLEECVMDGLRSLRLAFDMIPFLNKKRESIEHSGSPLVLVEERLLALWVQLFVAAFGCNHLLVTRLQFPDLAARHSEATGWFEYYSSTKMMINDLKKNRVDPLAVLVTPDGFWSERWRPWCELTQFHVFGHDPCQIATRESDKYTSMLDEFERSPRSRATKGRTNTFTDDLIGIESFLLKDKKVVNLLWNERRESSRVAGR